MKKLFVLSVLALFGCAHTSDAMFLGYHNKARIYEINCRETEQCAKAATKACPGEKVTVGNPNSTRYWVECVK